MKRLNRNAAIGIDVRGKNKMIKWVELTQHLTQREFIFETKKFCQNVFFLTKWVCDNGGIQVGLHHQINFRLYWF